jgi:hypothetical protein
MFPDVRKIHQPSSKHPQRRRFTLRTPIDHASIQISSQLIQLVPIPQAQLPKQRPGHGKAALLSVNVVSGMHLVAGRNVKGHAVNGQRVGGVATRAVEDFVVGT